MITGFFDPENKAMRVKALHSIYGTSQKGNGRGALSPKQPRTRPEWVDRTITPGTTVWEQSPGPVTRAGKSNAQNAKNQAPRVVDNSRIEKLSSIYVPPQKGNGRGAFPKQPRKHPEWLDPTNIPVGTTVWEQSPRPVTRAGKFNAELVNQITVDQRKVLINKRAMGKSNEYSNFPIAAAFSRGNDWEPGFSGGGTLGGQWGTARWGGSEEEWASR